MLADNPIPCATFDPDACANAIMMARLREDVPALISAAPVLLQLAANKIGDVTDRTSSDYDNYGFLQAADTFYVGSCGLMASAITTIAVGFVDSIAKNWETYSTNLIATEDAVAQNFMSGDMTGTYLAAQRGVIDVGVPAQRFGEQTVGTLAATWGLANAGVTAIEVGVNVLKTPIMLTPALVTVGGRTMAGAGAFAGEAEGIAGSLGTAGVGGMAMAASNSNSPAGKTPWQRTVEHYIKIWEKLDKQALTTNVKNRINALSEQRFYGLPRRDPSPTRYAPQDAARVKLLQQRGLNDLANELMNKIDDLKTQSN